MTTTHILLILILLAIIYSTDQGKKSLDSAFEEIILFPLKVFFFPWTLMDYIKNRKEKKRQSKMKDDVLKCFSKDEKELLKFDLIKDLSNYIRIRQDLDSFNKLENGQIDKIYLKLDNIYTTLYYIKEEKIDELKDRLLKP